MPDVLVRSVMSLHDGAKTRVRVDCELSEQFEVKVGMHQASVLSPFLFALVADVVTALARDSALSESLHADDLVLMSDMMEGLRDKSLRWKKSFESKGLKVNLGKTMVMVCSGITKDDLSKSNVDPCGVYSLKVKANSLVCVPSDGWIRNGCAGGKRVIADFS